jgi:hypothetical protein
MNVSGYAATYGVLSHDIKTRDGSFKERIAKRAFDKVLRSNPPDVVATFNHSVNHVLGRTGAGTLQLRSDDTGLHFKCNIAPTSYGKDLYESVKRGDISGCSFAFELGERSDESWEEEEIEDEKELGLRGKRGKQLVRTISNFQKLHDISIVTNPAYPGTSVDARHEMVAAECRSRVQQFVKRSAVPQRRSRREQFELELEEFKRETRRRKILLGIALDE